MSEVLFVRPAEDSAAIEMARCGKRLRDRTLEPKTDLSGTAVTRAAVDHALAGGVRALLWFGHGERDCLTRDGRPIVDAANVDGVEGVVVAIACFSGRILGPAAVAAGAAAFLGFDDPLGVPLADPDPTCDAIVEGLDGLVTSGHAIGCAADCMKIRLYHVREDCLADAENADDPVSELWTKWAWVKSNHLSIVVEGDDTAVL